MGTTMMYMCFCCTFCHVVSREPVKQIPFFSHPDPPFWPGDQRSRFYGFISGETNLTCEAVAEPPADFEWRDADGEVIADRVVREGHKSILTVRCTAWVFRYYYLSVTVLWESLT